MGTEFVPGPSLDLRGNTLVAHLTSMGYPVWMSKHVSNKVWVETTYPWSLEMVK